MAESLGLIVPTRGVTDAVDTRSEGERASFPDIVVNAIIRGVHAAAWCLASVLSRRI